MLPTKPAGDSGYLEAACRIIFMGGLNRQVVDGKWPGFREAFFDFDVERVAKFDDGDVDRLAADDRVIKYRAKLAAVVANARTMRELAAEHGSFAAYLEQLYAASGVPGASKDLSAAFSYISAEGAKHWLYSTGFDIGEVTEKIVRKYAPFA
jgi:3-methyladenine DNA glycosylase Tag